MFLGFEELSSPILTVSSGIREHLRITESSKAYRSAAFSRTSPTGSECFDGYAYVFKELFCVAASDLAATIQVPLEKLGILFDDIMSTGTLKRANAIRCLIKGSRAGDLEHAQAERDHASLVLGRGQLLFAVRQASKFDSMHLQAAGYCFTNPKNVMESLARSMQVSHQEIASRVKRMQKYVRHENTLEPGIHLACFALRPLLHRGFDILVRKDSRNLLPTVSLPLIKLEPWQATMLAQMDNWTVTSCCERLHGRSAFANEGEQHFVRQLSEGIKALADEISNSFFEDARLVARPLKVPCRMDVGKPGNAFIIAFRTITDCHELSTVNRRYEFAPLRFYICQQHTFRDSPDIYLFGRRIRREFAAIADSARNRQEREYHALNTRSSFMNGRRGLKKRVSLSPPRGRKWSHIRALSCGDLSIDNASEKNLVNVSTGQPVGGSPVSNETSNCIRRESSSPEQFEMRSCEVDGRPGMGDEEEETFAEKLVALTIDERKRQR